MLRARLPLLLVPLAFAACGPSNRESAPGGVTAGEARELNEAAAMLDANSVSTNAVGANEENDQ